MCDTDKGMKQVIVINCEQLVADTGIKLILLQ